MSESKKTIQAKIADLDGLVAWFNSDEFTLEAALEKFNAAEKLAEEIEADLQSLKNDIQVVKQRFDEK